ncbi:4Fe-4S dicluster domain-containing protein [Thermosediminibacter oceani]|uniref:4Fe-4S dicluster domain-containing protein n=1 Tax=Thermosediminibacter oceani TaxID=291990 RepID=UPI00031A2532|nr:4Fe-4S binding protein [Thermosediminibacter oceani]
MFVIDKTECIGCGTCYKLCPFDAIGEKEGGEKQVYEINDEMCMECSLCYKACPLRAINWEEGVLKGGGAIV